MTSRITALWCEHNSVQPSLHTSKHHSFVTAYNTTHWQATHWFYNYLIVTSIRLFLSTRRRFSERRITITTKLLLFLHKAQLKKVNGFNRQRVCCGLLYSTIGVRCLVWTLSRQQHNSPKFKEGKRQPHMLRARRFKQVYTWHLWFAAAARCLS